MKKQNGKDAKKAAANDKETKVEERYVLGNVGTVRRGFLLQFVQFVEKKGTVNADQLVAEFSGRQIDGHKVDAARVHRYIAYCKNNGQLRIAK
jgi:methionine synthase I (cobalamin-dependent)